MCVLYFQMPQASRPVRRLRTQIERDRSKGFFPCTDGEKILVQAGIIMSVEQPSRPLHAMAADQQMSAVGIAQERGDTRFINGYFHRIEPAAGFIGNLAGLLFAADADVTTEPQEPRKPRDEQDRGNGPRQLEQLCRHEARPRNISIIAVTGARS